MYFQRLIFRPLRYLSSKNNKNPLKNPEVLEGSSKDQQIPYTHPYNYNYETHKDYFNKHQQALQEYEQVQKSLENDRVVPRRQRRKYETPRHDRDITNYSAWRTFDRLVIKRDEGFIRMFIYLPIVPKQLVKAFGWGQRAYRDPKNSTYEYDFEDVNYDVFHVYDYKATQEYFGANRPDYDYENQENVHPLKRIQKWPTKEEFWTKIDEPYNFRLNCANYSDYRKFKAWILKTVQDSQNTVSFHETAQQKYGVLDTYDDYDKNYEIDSKPSILEFDKSFWLKEGDKIQPREDTPKKYYEKFIPAQKLDEQYRVKTKESE